MARKVFNDVEAVSAVMPGEGGYSAAIAVKAHHAGGAPRFHRVLGDQKFKTAHDADHAAAEELARLVDVDADGELVF
ncbi:MULTISPECIES: hypothetical protein [unclassified Pseudomonas]|uniref:hypothetical protein n=1 Tax=unclassified Pseudomonas TaxID=196821 RepID=UPI002AC8DFDB|nr:MULTISPECIES: hypothetical protein [unclassified Pseudomonas]MEB0039054.1 hypothetical protein [Pseudomonas sp. MH10]MEB0075578.1 hypothetical protein [Pseudomonas sp. MH10out]MEB0094353.1 hypothetical protein [Pseudomonas sp. CCI4.2]MEB0103848.1 hypothetical protein [Pseudomonas sp. CCI3.2]MEB0119998.1 hypothetical protein [Pseudomonas sp. CCI1.2]